MDFYKNNYAERFSMTSNWSDIKEKCTAPNGYQSSFGWGEEQKHVSDSAKVLLGTSLIIGVSAYWTFNKGGKGYDSMADKIADQKRKAELQQSEQAQ